jgi:glycosyltransferase involved in cell wall biosynthesis
VVSPFLDQQHGTERCVIEQITYLARDAHWTIDVYSQRVSDMDGIVQTSERAANLSGGIVWHRVSQIPGPHLLNYLWWFCANHWRRWRDRQKGNVRPALIYTPGINCLDADVIVVHIVFHAFYDRVRSELSFFRNSIRSWPLLIHRRLYYKLIMSLEKKMYRKANTRLIAVSNLLAGQLKDYFQRDDVAVIPNAVDTIRFNPESRQSRRVASREKFGFVETDFVVLLIGNDWKKKGLDALLQATALLRDLRLKLLVVGDDDPGLYAAPINTLSLDWKIRFSRTSPDVLQFYAACDLYAGPSLEDSFGLPILEAMACGVPAIVSSQAGASELVQDGLTGFILHDPRNHLQLAALIRRICSDEKLRAAIGAAACRYVLENCSWRKNAETTKEFLDRVRLGANRRKL